MSGFFLRLWVMGLVSVWIVFLSSIKAFAVEPEKAFKEIVDKLPKTESGILVADGRCADLLEIKQVGTQEIELYSVAEVRRLLQKLMASDQSVENPRVVDLYRSMIERGGSRDLIGAPSLSSFDDLMGLAPNHSEVIGDLKKRSALTLAASEPMQMDPILLLGDPGVGKTHFAQSLARLIGTSFELLPMSSMTAGWILSGTSSQWKNSRAGKVAQSLIDGQYANQVFVLDEIDKSGERNDYDPLGALYSLLESDTARVFKDEYLEVAMDARHVLWIATANDERLIPKPILSRMSVYVIPKPSGEEVAAIGLNIYRDILKKHPGWGFDPELSEGVLDRMAHLAPRDMKRIIMAACANAFADNRRHLEPKDLDLGREPVKKSGIGFVN